MIVGLTGLEVGRIGVFLNFGFDFVVLISLGVDFRVCWVCFMCSIKLVLSLWLGWLGFLCF